MHDAKENQQTNKFFFLTRFSIGVYPFYNQLSFCYPSVHVRLTSVLSFICPVKIVSKPVYWTSNGCLTDE